MTYEGWTRRSEKPLLIAALIFVVVLCMPIIEPNLSGTGDVVVRSLNIGIWLLFAVDYVTRLVLVDDRRRFVRRNIPDLLVVFSPRCCPMRHLARSMQYSHTFVVACGWKQK